MSHFSSKWALNHSEGTLQTENASKNQPMSTQQVPNRVFKSPSPTAFPGSGDGESPPLKQILEKNFKNWFVVNTLKFFF